MVHGRADERNGSRRASCRHQPHARRNCGRSSRPLWRAPRARRASSCTTFGAPCSAGSGTFPDLVHPTPSILTTINEVARNLGGSEAKGQRCFDEHVGVVLNQSTVAAGVTYEPLESKPGDGADFNDGLTDGFTIELWLTPMHLSSSDQVLVALEQPEPGATSLECIADSDCDDVCSCNTRTPTPTAPDQGTCDLTCSNKADRPVPGCCSRRRIAGAATSRARAPVQVLRRRRVERNRSSARVAGASSTALGIPG